MVEDKVNQVSVVDHYILANPKNSRRRRNKIVVENESFELLFDTQAQEFSLSKKDDLFFSIIPYDTSRKYIEKAIFIYLNSPQELDAYLEKHQGNLITYIQVSLFQVRGERFEENSPEVLAELEKVATDNYFKIQVAGRLLQHDETGPLSATLPYKFLYDFNLKTGIHGYIAELIIFYQSQLRNLPIYLGQGAMNLIGENSVTVSNEMIAMENQLMLNNGVTRKLKKSQMSPNQLVELRNIRKNYKAHSRNPGELAKYFDNVHDHLTFNKINVVSDIHSPKNIIDLTSPNFNIIAGDLSDAFATNSELKGIAVIGNHDIVECGLEIEGLLPPKLMESLKDTTDINYSLIKIDDTKLYATCKKHLESRYTGLTFLNNQSYLHNGVRYIGLSVPICYVKERKKVQRYLAKVLESLLDGDRGTPTVVISHAPLFNELSLLSPQSKSYRKEFKCENKKIEKLLMDYNILGVIHGHHHIRPSSGVIDFREFASKRVFVICSIYSFLNQGFDLQLVLDEIDHSPVKSTRKIDS